MSGADWIVTGAAFIAGFFTTVVLGHWLRVRRVARINEATEAFHKALSLTREEQAAALGIERIPGESDEELRRRILEHELTEEQRALWGES